MSQEQKNKDSPREQSESNKTKEEDFFRTPRDKVKFGIEIALMVMVGFLCIYPLSLFLGNFLR